MSKTSKTESTLKEHSKPLKTKNAKKTEISIPDDSELTLSNSKKIIKYIIIGIAIILVSIFFIRTAIWEHFYYKNKEGSERATAETVSTSEELDETPVTEEDRTAYTVAADLPRYLSIEKLNIKNARVLQMGLKSNGELDTPSNIFDVGWYNASGKPGDGGTLLIDGHNGGPNVIGVFKYLNQLVEGDAIVIERGDGKIFTYKVVENNEIPLSESDDYMTTAMTSPVHGQESLTLISCVGEWSQAQRTYLSRQFVRAVLVSE